MKLANRFRKIARHPYGSNVLGALTITLGLPATYLIAELFLLPLSTASVAWFLVFLLSVTGIWYLRERRRKGPYHWHTIPFAIPVGVAIVSLTICFLSPLIVGGPRIYLTANQGYLPGASLTDVLRPTLGGVSLFDRADVVRARLFPLIARAFGKEVRVIAQDGDCLRLPLVMLRRRPGGGMGTSGNEQLSLMFGILEERAIDIRIVSESDFTASTGGGVAIFPIIDRMFAWRRSSDSDSWSCVTRTEYDESGARDVQYVAALDFALEKLADRNWEHAIEIVDVLRTGGKHSDIEDARLQALYALVVLKRIEGNIGAMQAAQIVIEYLPKMRALIQEKKSGADGSRDRDLLFWTLSEFQQVLFAVRQNPVFDTFKSDLGGIILAAGFPELLNQTSHEDDCKGMIDSFKEQEWAQLKSRRVPPRGWTLEERLDIEWSLIDKLRWETQEWGCANGKQKLRGAQLAAEAQRHLRIVDEVLDLRRSLDPVSTLPIEFVADRERCLIIRSLEEELVKKEQLQSIPKDRSIVRCMDQLQSPMVVDMQLMANFDQTLALKTLVLNCGGSPPSRHWWSTPFLNCFAAASKVLRFAKDRREEILAMRDALTVVMKNLSHDSTNGPFSPGLALCAAIENRSGVPLGDCSERFPGAVPGSDRVRKSAFWPLTGSAVTQW